jgi:hypothetical protein
MKRNTAKQSEQGGVSMPGTFGAVLLFALPTWLTSLFNTLYTIVDGIFVSRYAGTDALAAINTVYPLVNILTAAALLFATGDSAIAAIALGSRDQDRADRAFSVSMTFPIVLDSCFSASVLAFFPSILAFLGATDRTMAGCRIYALCWLLGCPAAIGKELFSCFIRVDGSPAYSFATALRRHCKHCSRLALYRRLWHGRSGCWSCHGTGTCPLLRDGDHLVFITRQEASLSSLRLFALLCASPCRKRPLGVRGSDHNRCYHHRLQPGGTLPCRGGRDCCRLHHHVPAVSRHWRILWLLPGDLSASRIRSRMRGPCILQNSGAALPDFSSCAPAASIWTDLLVCACPCGILRSGGEPCPCPLGPWASALRTWLSVLRLEHLLRNPAHSLQPGTPGGAHYLPSLLLPASCFFCSCGLLPGFLGLDGIWLSVPCAEFFTLPVSLFFLHRDHAGERISISRRDTLAA